VTHHDLELLGRIAVALGLCFVLGFEREVRGADAGDRTFSLVGVGAASVVAVAVPVSPNAVAGIVTGIGFIGAGVMFRVGDHLLRGLTTAATIWTAAAVGVVAGLGHLLLATILSALILVDLELRYIPVLRALDARRWREGFTSDISPPGPLRHHEASTTAPPPGSAPPTKPYD
jgi:putative Mg2+ transporter-C (MgtC) family protein